MPAKIERKQYNNRHLVRPFSLSNVLCNTTDLIWRKGTPFEAMTSRNVPLSDEVFRAFRQL